MFLITSIMNNEELVSVFSEEEYPVAIDGGMVLTDRIGIKNFRFRKSEPGYKTDFHVAGDPTLIIIQAGELKISLQNGDSKSFKAGDCFIAKDYLPANVNFDSTKHGHKAMVIGDKTLLAIHIKMSFLGS